uniref:Uncharacterized protein n=1 Tax=Elaeophora elaphi TaxID=1147741 RepID=A0A0R3S1J6_9BILA
MQEIVYLLDEIFVKFSNFPIPCTSHLQTTKKNLMLNLERDEDFAMSSKYSIFTLSYFFLLFSIVLLIIDIWELITKSAVLFNLKKFDLKNNRRFPRANSCYYQSLHNNCFHLMLYACMLSCMIIIYLMLIVLIIFISQELMKIVEINHQ